MKNNLYLVGFMGCGKSTVGRILSTLTSFQFIDTDEWVEKRAGLTISDIFKTEGEAAFRRLEAEVVNEAASQSGPRVVALGGGTLLDPANFLRVSQTGIQIYLNTDLVTLKERLKNSYTHRPLLGIREEFERERFIESLLQARTPFYEKADLQIITREKNPTEISEEILRKLGLT